MFELHLMMNAKSLKLLMINGICFWLPPWLDGLKNRSREHISLIGRVQTDIHTYVLIAILRPPAVQNIRTLVNERAVINVQPDMHVRTYKL